MRMIEEPNTLPPCVNDVNLPTTWRTSGKQAPSRNRVEDDLLPDVMYEVLWLINEPHDETVRLAALVRGIVLHGVRVEELVKGPSPAPPPRPVSAHGEGPSEPGTGRATGRVERGVFAGEQGEGRLTCQPLARGLCLSSSRTASPADQTQLRATRGRSQIDPRHPGALHHLKGVSAGKDYTEDHKSTDRILCSNREIQRGHLWGNLAHCRLLGALVGQAGAGKRIAF